WDLFLMCFSSTHRAGHQLWDRTSLLGSPSDNELEEFDDALRQVYIATDRAVGKMLERIDDRTSVLVFSLHGMGKNTSRTVITNKILSRVLAGQSADEKQFADSFASRLRKLIPLKLRSYVKSRLPLSLQDKLTIFWRVRGIKWAETRAFALFGDLDAYVQINLRGREAEGIVEPGTEYRDLCEYIAAGFKSFADAQTGESVVDSVEFSYQSFPVGRNRGKLPDIIIHWAQSSAANHQKIISPEFGSIDWPTPGRHPQGRSGDHARRGFLIANGFQTADTSDGDSIIDLAPTVYDLLNVEAPSDFHGKSLASSQS
ncbi:MAG: putative AlkP superfamily phosphohydrolase/phosphomutase, partial [Woeseiaceae bacterium]